MFNTLLNSLLKSTGSTVHRSSVFTMSLYRDSEGEVLVYQWIECIRDRINTHGLSTRSVYELLYSSLYTVDVLVSVEATADVTAQEDYDTAASGDTSIHMHSHTSVSSSTGEMTESDPSFKSQCRGVQASDSTQLCGGETRCPVIVHGEPLTDRKSTFQAHAAVINRRQEVRLCCMIFTLCECF